MNFLQAIFLGIVQGLTEFLPVSSSGHLAFFKNVFKMNTDTGVLFDVMLHVATLIAICIVMNSDIKKLINAALSIVSDIAANISMFVMSIKEKSGKPEYRILSSSNYRKFTLMVIVSSIPTAILGFLLKDIIETVESGLVVPGFCLIITGCLLFFSDLLKEQGKKPKDASYLDAFYVGLSQGIATLPGISRSGTTITACLLCGFDRKFAVKYSFIMSIPAILGAMLLEIKDVFEVGITFTDFLLCIVGMIFAFIVGFLALKFMLKIVQKKQFRFFAIYCFIIGFLSVILSIFIK